MKSPSPAQVLTPVQMLPKAVFLHIAPFQKYPVSHSHENISTSFGSHFPVVCDKAMQGSAAQGSATHSEPFQKKPSSLQPQVYFVLLNGVHIPFEEATEPHKFDVHGLERHSEPFQKSPSPQRSERTHFTV